VAIRTASDNASLLSQLKAAQAGDVILLKGGTYATLTIRDLNKIGVTIRSADEADRAVFTDLSVKSVAGLTFQDVDLRPSASNFAGYVSFSNDVVFDGLRVYGSLDGDPRNDKGGLHLGASSNLTVRNSEFEQLYWGLSHQGVTGLTVSDNHFHDLRMDGVRGGGSSDVLIERNLFTDFYMVAGDHGDAVQFWTANTTVSARDIVVRDNVVLRGAGDAVQGVFFGDELGLPYQNVRIEGNLVVGTIWRGVSVASGRDIVIAGNTVTGLPDQKSYIFGEKITGLQMTDNRAMHFLGAAAVPLAALNEIVPASTDGGHALLQAWLAENASLPLSEALRSLGETPPPAGKVITGTAGVDVLTGTAATDVLRGLAGNDRLEGGADGDVLDGGDGFDLAVYASAKTGVTLDFGRGVHKGDAAGDTFVSIEGFNLTAHADVFVGRATVDLVRGGGGDDRLNGAGGDDKLFGGAGDDTLIGGAGRDYLQGDGGNDVLTGGADRDTFVFGARSGHDRITDFEDGLDMLRLVGVTDATSFAHLKVSSHPEGTLVSWSGGTASVVLVGVSPAQVTAADVLFG
jgi:Ca2+-binding RTX toxin-like protein